MIYNRAQREILYGLVTCSLSLYGYAMGLNHTSIGGCIQCIHCINIELYVGTIRWTRMQTIRDKDTTFLCWLHNMRANHVTRSTTCQQVCLVGWTGWIYSKALDSNEVKSSAVLGTKNIMNFTSTHDVGNLFITRYGFLRRYKPWILIVYCRVMLSNYSYWIDFIEDYEIEYKSRFGFTAVFFYLICALLTFEDMMCQFVVKSTGKYILFSNIYSNFAFRWYIARFLKPEFMLHSHLTFGNAAGDLQFGNSAIELHILAEWANLCRYNYIHIWAITIKILFL